MEERTYICGGQTFVTMQGYIVLPIKVASLPETISVAGVVLKKKTEFHVSLFHIDAFANESSDKRQHVIEFFCAHTKEHPLSFRRYTGAFRYAQEVDKKSVVALCEVDGLDALTEALGKMLGVHVPPQPAHVTLFTFQTNESIGLNSPEDIETKSVPVEVSDEVKRSLTLL